MVIGEAVGVMVIEEFDVIDLNVISIIVCLIAVAPEFSLIPHYWMIHCWC